MSSGWASRAVFDFGTRVGGAPALLSAPSLVGLDDSCPVGVAEFGRVIAAAMDTARRSPWDTLGPASLAVAAVDNWAAWTVALRDVDGLEAEHALPVRLSGVVATVYNGVKLLECLAKRGFVLWHLSTFWHDNVQLVLIRIIGSKPLI